MTIKCKLIYLIIIVSCLVPNAISRKTDTIETKSDSNIKKSLQQQDNKYDKIKTLITNSIPNTNKDDTVDNENTAIISDSDRLYARFVEKTGFNNIKEIDGQSVESIKEEINNLDDSKLNEECLKDYSQGLLKFIATGDLNYGSIKPDAALFQYNSIVDKKLQLDRETVDKERQQDIAEINAREDLQDLDKEYNEILQRNEDNIDPSTGEVIQCISEAFKSSNNGIQNALIDAYLSVDNNTLEKLVPPTKEEINELKKIIEERIDLPGARKSLGIKLKKFVWKIKNWFKENKQEEKTNTENINATHEVKNNQQIKLQSVNDNENKSNSILSNTLTKDEVVELMMENSAIID